MVIDVQNDFCHPEGAQAKQGKEISAMTAVVPNIITLIEEGRKARLQILFIRACHNKFTRSEAWENKKGGPDVPHLCDEGSWGADFYMIKPLPDEHIIFKSRYSAFIGTDLDIILRCTGIKTLILSGVTTNTCVESTARQGFMMDYNIVFLEDCTATHYIEEHKAALNNIEQNYGFVTSSTELFKIWAAL
jgi:ureidoacrylate peracid hydrolase